MMAQYLGLINKLQNPRKFHTCIISAFVNLALKKPAYQSSVSFNGTADLAVDGDATKNYFAGSCTHTDMEQNPWWAVDLQGEYHLTKVKIHERDDAGADGGLYTYTIVWLSQGYNECL